jgi:hypothetical protein
MSDILASGLVNGLGGVLSGAARVIGPDLSNGSFEVKNVGPVGLVVSFYRNSSIAGSVGSLSAYDPSRPKPPPPGGKGKSAAQVYEEARTDWQGNAREGLGSCRGNYCAIVLPTYVPAGWKEKLRYQRSFGDTYLVWVPATQPFPWKRLYTPQEFRTTFGQNMRKITFPTFRTQEIPDAASSAARAGGRPVKRFARTPSRAAGLRRGGRAPARTGPCRHPAVAPAPPPPLLGGRQVFRVSLHPPAPHPLALAHPVFARAPLSVPSLPPVPPRARPRARRQRRPSPR